MHLAEGVLPLEQAAVWSAIAAPAVVWSLRGARGGVEGSDPDGSQDTTAPAPALMAGATSLLFAATLLPLPVPVVGATSHICLTPVLALILGVRNIVWPTFFVLALQAIFFAHGGITTLGINTLTLGVLGPLAAVGLWAAFRRAGLANAMGLAAACGLADLSVYLADAAILAMGLSDVTAPATTFTAVLLGFAPVQVPLAILEAVASVGIVRLLATRRPDLLPESLRALRSTPRASAAVLLVGMTTGVLGCTYEGIDGTVFGVTAESAGRPPTESLLDLSQGELGLAMTILILFGLGFVAGRAWERLLGEERDASRR